jgi:hypothetical protein
MDIIGDTSMAFVCGIGVLRAEGALSLSPPHFFSDKRYKISWKIDFIVTFLFSMIYGFHC